MTGVSWLPATLYTLSGRPLVHLPACLIVAMGCVSCAHSQRLHGRLTMSHHTHVVTSPNAPNQPLACRLWRVLDGRGLPDRAGEVHSRQPALLPLTCPPGVQDYSSRRACHVVLLYRPLPLKPADATVLAYARALGAACSSLTACD